MPTGMPNLPFHLTEGRRDLTCEVGGRQQIIQPGDHQAGYVDVAQITVHLGCQTCRPSVGHCLTILVDDDGSSSLDLRTMSLEIERREDVAQKHIRVSHHISRLSQSTSSIDEARGLFADPSPRADEDETSDQ